MNDQAAIRTSGVPLAGGWLAVATLLLAYAVSFLDRQIISLLVEPIKADLQITDTQIGILQGTAFGVFYAVMGWPLGWLADRADRVRLVALAVALWSAMTIASGLAQSFTGLLLARIGVAVGEAALVPAAVSLLSDYFSPLRRALPLSVFTSGISVGLGLALVLGGGLIAYAHGGVSDLPLLGAWLGAQRDWQIVFVLCGLLGLPVAGLVLFLPEPRRRAAEQPLPRTAITPRATGVEAWQFLWRERAVVGCILLATSLLYILTTSFSAWVPAHFMRRFGWTAAQTGQTIGVPIMLVGIAGNWLSGAVAQFMARRGALDGPLRTMLAGACLLVPAAALGPLAPGSAIAMFGVISGYFAIALTFGIATTAYVAITPAPLRGQVIAIYLLCGNLLGLGLGPLLVGAIADHAAGRLHDIGTALALVCVVTSLPAVWLLQRARAGFARAASAVAVSPSMVSPGTVARTVS
jgi:MFS family permease